MCGIVAALGGDGHAETLIDALGHRGPGGDGAVALNGCSLAMTRLAVLDPTPRADQPMTRRGATLVFNGEIFNFRELRSDLEHRGWAFETSGDAEVLLASLLE